MSTVDRAGLELRQRSAVRSWMAVYGPDAVMVAAATVGGMEANHTRPAEFLYNNVFIFIAANVIHAAAETDVSKLLFLGSSYLYPSSRSGRRPS